jgi:hypothetical protein
MTYEEKVQFLFKRFTYKTTQTATTQEWYKNDEPSQLGQLDSWEQDGCHYLLNNGPPRVLTVKNSSETNRSISNVWTVAPGESFTTKDQSLINNILNKPSIFQKTAISEAISLAAEELKTAAECPKCGKVLTPEDLFDCPHGPDLNYVPNWNEQEFGTFVGGVPVAFDKPGKKVVYGTKQISPVEKPKGRFIKLK